MNNFILKIFYLLCFVCQSISLNSTNTCCDITNYFHDIKRCNEKELEKLSEKQKVEEERVFQNLKKNKYTSNIDGSNFYAIDDPNMLKCRIRTISEVLNDTLIEDPNLTFEELESIKNFNNNILLPVSKERYLKKKKATIEAIEYASIKRYNLDKKRYNLDKTTNDEEYTRGNPPIGGRNGLNKENDQRVDTPVDQKKINVAKEADKINTQPTEKNSLKDTLSNKEGHYVEECYKVNPPIGGREVLNKEGRYVIEKNGFNYEFLGTSWTLSLNRHDKRGADERDLLDESSTALFSVHIAKKINQLCLNMIRAPKKSLIATKSFSEIKRTEYKSQALNFIIKEEKIELCTREETDKFIEKLSVARKKELAKEFEMIINKAGYSSMRFNDLFKDKNNDTLVLKKTRPTSLELLNHGSGFATYEINWEPMFCIKYSSMNGFKFLYFSICKSNLDYSTKAILKKELEKQMIKLENKYLFPLDERFNSYEYYSYIDVIYSVKMRYFVNHPLCWSGIGKRVFYDNVDGANPQNGGDVAPRLKPVCSQCVPSVWSWMKKGICSNVSFVFHNLMLRACCKKMNGNFWNF